jgi:hypothetical protein
LEVPELDEHLSLLSIYGYRLEIGYFGTVKFGGVRSSRFLGGFRGWSLVLAVWTLVREVVLIWLTSRWGETAARVLLGSYADAQDTRKAKTGLALVILNSMFRFCIWRTGRLLSVICDASKW